MKLAFIELEDHLECLDSLLKILSHHRNEKSLFTTEHIYNELRSSIVAADIKVFIKPENVSVKNFLLQQLDSINTHELVFFLTMQKQLDCYPLKKINIIKILRIHNGHTFSNNSPRFYTPPESFIYFIRDIKFIFLKLSRIFLFQTKVDIHKSIDYFSFPDNTITSYVKVQGLYPREKILSPIPFAVSYNTVSSKTNEQLFTMVIPGLVDVRRKNFLHILDALTEIKSKLQNCIHVILLGKPVGTTGKKVVKQFQNLNCDKIKISVFFDRIPQSDYIQIMSTSSILISPIKINTRYNLFKETYGLSKQSGSIADMIRYGKLLILPGELEVDEKYEKTIQRYSNTSDLVRVLLNVIKHELSQRYIESLNNLNAEYSSPSVYLKLISEFKNIKASIK